MLISLFIRNLMEILKAHYPLISPSFVNVKALD